MTPAERLGQILSEHSSLTYSEIPARLLITSGITPSVIASVQAVLRDLTSDDPMISGVFAEDRIESEIDLATIAADDNSLGRIIIEKRVDADVECFLTVQGLSARCLMMSPLPPCVRVALPFEPFSSYSTQFLPISAEPLTATDASLPIIDPRIVVHDIGSRLLPTNVSAWLPRHIPDAPSLVFTTWVVLAIPRAAACLLTEVWSKGTAHEGRLKGIRKRTLELGGVGEATATTVAAAVRDLGRWVFSEERGLEVRHAVLANEIALEAPEGATLLDALHTGAPRLLLAAKDAYRISLLEANEKSAKALAELRKAASDDLGRVIAQTREMSAQVWKDTAIAVAAVIARVAVLSPDKAPPFASDIVFLVAIVILACNLGLLFWMQQRFDGVSDESIAAWRVKLYGILSEDEYRRLYVDPLQSARSVASDAKTAVMCQYLAVIIGLIIVLAVS